jgi:hypothetical protein
MVQGLFTVETALRNEDRRDIKVVFTSFQGYLFPIPFL